jgi:Domain of unknown function (DUF4442)
MSANFFRKISSNLSVNTQRRIMNFYFPFLGAGIKCTRVTDDYLQLDVKMNLTWYNRNYVGTHFGGSLYAMTDPYYMFMLINILGPGYIVWDKAAKIDFKKPGKGTVYAFFKFEEYQIAEIKRNADDQPTYVFDLPVSILNAQNEVIAEVIKTLYVKNKLSQVKNETRQTR